MELRKGICDSHAANIIVKEWSKITHCLETIITPPVIIYCEDQKADIPQLNKSDVRYTKLSNIEAQKQKKRKESYDAFNLLNLGKCFAFK